MRSMSNKIRIPSYMIINKKRVRNPCDICIVKTMCSEVCLEVVEYYYLALEQRSIREKTITIKNEIQ